MIADSLRAFAGLVLAGENGFQKEIPGAELHSCTTHLTESEEHDFLWVGESAAFCTTEMKYSIRQKLFLSTLVDSLKSSPTRV